MPFKKGDICICQVTLNKRKVSKKGCKVRITSIAYEFKNNQFVQDNYGKFCYNVYNIDFDRYEKIGGRFLKLDLQENRQSKINKLLDDIDKD